MENTLMRQILLAERPGPLGEPPLALPAEIPSYTWRYEARSLHQGSSPCMVIKEQLDTSSETKLAEVAEGQSVFSADISPDGKWIAYAHGKQGDPKDKLTIISAAGGSAKSELDLPSTAIERGRIRWMPDGKGITFLNDDILWIQPIDGDLPGSLRSSLVPTPSVVNGHRKENSLQ